jgi:hypothetical protein
MTRHGPRQLPAQAYPLRPTTPLVVRIPKAALIAKIRRDGFRLRCGINRQDRASPIIQSQPAVADTRRLPRQNQKSP